MIQQIIEFGQNHWLLCSAGAIVLALIIFEEIKSKISGILKISVQDASLLINRENAIVVDLRNSKAFANGHILGAINITSANIDHDLKKLYAHKNKAMILISDRDADISTVGSRLRTKGFTKIHILAGGLNSWKEAQLPLIKD